MHQDREKKSCGSTAGGKLAHGTAAGAGLPEAVCAAVSLLASMVAGASAQAVAGPARLVLAGTTDLSLFHMTTNY